MKKFVLLVFLSAFSVFSQNLHQRFDAFPVIIGGSPANSPFSGGIDIARYQFVDMDNDNDFDLFIYDKDTNLNYYRNEGSPSSASFKMQTKKYFSLSFKNWFFFTDIDNDNDKDLFCGGDSQHVRYIKNIGSASNPAYQLQTFMLLSDLGQPVISEAPCIPVFVDIDADGDIDFITGSQIGQLTYYQNIGNASNFNFRFITDFFAGLRIIGGGYDLHGASSITFEDIDSDGDRDLFWGDLFNPSLYFIRNTGTAQNFSWTVIDSTYPVPNAWFSGGYNMPRVHDIDNDGKKDLFLTVLTGTSAKNNFTYYRNTGTVINPQFTKITENFIKTIEVGGSSFPFFADIDNDGDFDLFIGGDRPYVSFFRNSGSASSPQLTLETDSLPIAYSNFNFSPTIADLDNDGRKDLVCGAFDGKLRYYKNNGTVQNPIFSFTASQFDGIDVGQSSAPLFFDLDNDNDFDMLVGNSDGKLYYYINNGSPASFNFQLVTSNYQSIFVGNDSAPSLGDLDGDGDPDMLVGCRLGVIYYYINNGSVGNPNFSFVSNNYAGINVFYTSIPAIVDINTDSDKDLFVGNVKGGLYFYENWNVFGIKQIGSEIPKDFKLYQNYPNPFNPVTSFKFQVSSSALVNIKVYDVLGKEVQTIINEQLSSGIYEVEWDASNYPSGIYFYRIIAGEFHQTKKMMLVK